MKRFLLFLPLLFCQNSFSSFDEPVKQVIYLSGKGAYDTRDTSVYGPEGNPTEINSTRKHKFWFYFGIPENLQN